MKSNSVGKIFNDAYQKLLQTPETVLDKGTHWAITMMDVKLAPGHMSCFENTEGVRFILVGTRFGVVGIYDSEPNQVDGGYYVKWLPDSKLVSSVLSSGTPFVSTAEMACIVGPWGKMDRNIGFLVEDIIEELKEELGK